MAQGSSSIEFRYGWASHSCKGLVPDATYDLLTLKGKKIVFTGPPWEIFGFEILCPLFWPVKFTYLELHKDNRILYRVEGNGSEFTNIFTSEH